MRTIFFNGTVITPETMFKGGVVTEGKKIESVFSGESPVVQGRKIDCKGGYISPGFVDIHVHGAYDGSFCSNSIDELYGATRFHALHGTTSILPTTASLSHENVLTILKNIRCAMQAGNDGARVMGGHLEGNYLNPKCAGAQNPEYLCKVDPAEYMELIDTGVVRRVSAAPEVEGAMDMARRLSPQGILMSIAHSNADYSVVMRAIESGFSHITHIYNAQSMLTSCYFYPKIGVCEAALLQDEITVEAICDGKHLPPELLRLIYRIKGADNMHAVTDTDLAGAQDGEYESLGLKLLVEDDVCMLASREAFAGSMATMDRLVHVLYRKAGVPLVDAVKMTTLTPARQINEHHHIGRLAAGYDADINVFDEDIHVLSTMILGEFYKNKL